MNTPLPCPFCAHQPIIIERYNGYALPTVECVNPKCPAMVDVAGQTVEEAVQLWNDRKYAP